jgi:hypothetical protein
MQILHHAIDGVQFPPHRRGTLLALCLLMDARIGSMVDELAAHTRISSVTCSGCRRPHGAAWCSAPSTKAGIPSQRRTKKNHHREIEPRLEDNSPCECLSRVSKSAFEPPLAVGLHANAFQEYELAFLSRPSDNLSPPKSGSLRCNGTTLSKPIPHGACLPNEFARISPAISRGGPRFELAGSIQKRRRAGARDLVFSAPQPVLVHDERSTDGYHGRGREVLARKAFGGSRGILSGYAPHSAMRPCTLWAMAVASVMSVDAFRPRARAVRGVPFARPGIRQHIRRVIGSGGYVQTHSTR